VKVNESKAWQRPTTCWATVHAAHVKTSIKSLIYSPSRVEEYGTGGGNRAA